MQRTRSISETSIIEDVLTGFPATLAVFVRRGMHCPVCGVARFDTIRDAAREYQQDLAGLLAELTVAASEQAVATQASTGVMERDGDDGEPAGH